MCRSEAKLTSSLLFLILLTGLPVTAQTTNFSGKKLPSRANVEFNQHWSVKDVVALANKHKVKISQLESSYVIGSTEIYDGYVNPETGTTADLEANYAKKRLDYFADIVALESNMANYERIELQPRLNAMKAILNKRQNIAPVRVAKASFYGETSNLIGIAQSNISAKVSVIDQQTIQKLIQERIQRESLPRRFGPEYVPNQVNEHLNFQHLFAALNPS
ncbi:hypothetical protein [Chroogloeocystis siderophila]|jgi:hypothetical protein|uniref:Uncharacterized protein n=1 Tax=Chroogloeocystis siderophila 5.2 s.c.1 TaxID=247279 RepID=A0A1U7HXN0_9CHRO|nr:hypothetical protein [Chroogloeocystis siderophila]OKH28404.1 hypothetical protein NIES1031_03965 [Chroogloeocystis siderophila 5.2 s.c.1]